LNYFPVHSNCSCCFAKPLCCYWSGYGLGHV